MRVYSLLISIGLSIGTATTAQAQQELILPIVLSGCYGPSCSQPYQVYVQVFAPDGPMRFLVFGYDGSGGPTNISCDAPTLSSSVGGCCGVSGAPFFENLYLCLGGAKNAWIRFTNATSIPATVSLQIFHTANAAFSTPIISTVTIPAVVAAKGFVAGVSGSGYDAGLSPERTAYAIVNPSQSSTAIVQIKAIDLQANVLCSTSLTLPPLGRIAKFFDELLPSCQREVFPGKTLSFRADIPIAVGGLGITPEGHFIVLPVQSIP